MAMYDIILQGAGGHAKVLIDCALAQGHTVECLFDPNGEGSVISGFPYGEHYPQITPMLRRLWRSATMH